MGMQTDLMGDPDGQGIPASRRVKIERPSTQYRIVLVLVAVLTLFLSWSLALPHTGTMAWSENFL